MAAAARHRKIEASTSLSGSTTQAQVQHKCCMSRMFAAPELQSKRMALNFNDLQTEMKRVSDDRIFSGRANHCRDICLGHAERIHGRGDGGREGYGRSIHRLH